MPFVLVSSHFATYFTLFTSIGHTQTKNKQTSKQSNSRVGNFVRYWHCRCTTLRRRWIVTDWTACKEFNSECCCWWWWLYRVKTEPNWYAAYVCVCACVVSFQMYSRYVCRITRPIHSCVSVHIGVLNTSKTVKIVPLLHGEWMDGWLFDMVVHRCFAALIGCGWHAFAIVRCVCEPRSMCSKHMFTIVFIVHATIVVPH